MSSEDVSADEALADDVAAASFEQRENTTVAEARSQVDKGKNAIDASSFYDTYPGYSELKDAVKALEKAIDNYDMEITFPFTEDDLKELKDLIKEVRTWRRQLQKLRETFEAVPGDFSVETT